MHTNDLPEETEDGACGVNSVELPSLLKSYKISEPIHKYAYQETVIA